MAQRRHQHVARIVLRRRRQRAVLRRGRELRQKSVFLRAQHRQRHRQIGITQVARERGDDYVRVTGMFCLKSEWCLRQRFLLTFKVTRAKTIHLESSR
jgi:hypothetical protein